MSNYPYTSGQGVSALDPTTPRGDTDPISDLDDAIRQIKAYLLDNTVGPDAKMAGVQSQITNLQNQFGTKFVPTGTITAFAGVNAPSGWLICNGAEVGRTDYPDLYLSIGIGFGPGNSATTFNLPDLRGRVPVGMDQGTNRAPGVTLGAAGGEYAHTITSNEMPAHTHLLTFVGPNNVNYGYGHGGYTYYFDESPQPPGPNTTLVGYRNDSDDGGNFKFLTGTNDAVAPDTHKSGVAGSSQAHNNMQPYQGVQYIIKV